MKEKRFIEQNKEKWSEFDELLQSKSKDPQKLSNLFVQITEDLSVAKTYFPNRMVKAYLNNSSQKLFLSLYKNKQRPFKKLQFFFFEEMPFIIYKARKELLISFFVFALATIIGIISCLNDPNYAEIVTSKMYVEMTEKNIESGDPMAVYKKDDAFNMFLRIAWNNLRVAFYCFALGITACVGTIFFLLINGTMLGGFQFFFYKKGVFLESLLTIWQHGTIEILAIIIAGGAGIVMGAGVIFPGTYPRTQALQISAKKGLKIMLALVPLIILAAFIEAYITRLTHFPIIFRLFVIFSSLAIMLGYFVYLPYLKYKNGFHASLQYEKPPTQKPIKILLEKVKSSGDLFSEAFIIYTKKLSGILPVALILGLAYGLLHVFYYQEKVYVIDFSDFGAMYMEYLRYSFFSFLDFFNYNGKMAFLPLNIISFTFIMIYSIKFIFEEKNQEISFGFKTIFALLILSVVLNISLATGIEIGFFFFLIFIPFIGVWMSNFVHENTNVLNAGIATMKKFLTEFATYILLWLMLNLVLIVFMLLSNSTIAGFILDFVSTNFVMESDAIAKFYAFSSAFVAVFSFVMFMPVHFIAYQLFYFSQKEKLEANYLKSRIEKFETL